MKEPSLSSFGLTERQVASARRAQKNDGLWAVVGLYGIFPLGIIAGSLWAFIFISSDYPGWFSGGVLIGIVCAMIFLGPWVFVVATLEARCRRKSSKTLEMHQEFIKAREEWHTKKRQLVAQFVTGTEKWREAQPPQGEQQRDGQSDEQGNKPPPADDRPPIRSEELKSESASEMVLGRKPSSWPKEQTSQDTFQPALGIEGERRLETNYAVVRDKKLREAAIRIHGRDCCVCGANFDRIYGRKLAKGYIEIHHLKSVSTGVRATNPATDLVPLCANCHKMADRLASQTKSPPTSIAELRALLFQGPEAPKKRKPRSNAAPKTTKVGNPPWTRKKAPNKSS